MFNYPRVKVEPQAKPSSQGDPVIQAFSQKFDKFTTKIMQRRNTLMNRMVVIQRKRGSRSNLTPKNQFNKDKSFPRTTINGDCAMQQNIPNTLAPTNLVGQGGSPWYQSSQDPHEDSPYEQEEEEENPEHLNVVNDTHAFNILLGDTYFYTEPSQTQIDANQTKLVLVVENSGRFKGLQYYRKNNYQDKTSSSSRNPPQGKDNPWEKNLKVN